MTRYQVDSEAVLAATNVARGTIDRIQTEVGGLHSQLAGLQDSWSGQAASAFQQVVAEWRATEQRVAECLSNINVALAQAGQQYAEAESSNARLFAR